MNDGGFGPGIGAFAIFFTLAIVLWLLMRNMNARLRRMTYADRQAERERSTPTGGDATAGDAGSDSGRDPVQGD
ncbi:MAG TPA: hypothetical protein PLA46_10395 [Phycicoccus sp.]|mgnify:CR=1 FL=1|jgi:flagellar biosynthesis/type III secretory pathway M-ring protein FliF/YscJ|nr:hypothetical protein [Phycicoccus sp.]HQK32978.1 hypothetical protein [Phycicoccus sp.]HQV91982.1 hypothetical protein [Phycicoccus sp.]HQY96566.1 hypothetical protein [Phycicoccus sp.]HRA44286.1 hypothetical protein [Phycicoccus sp.]